MKMAKRLFLGSAAGLIAVSGAQAADLPVKAKAIEYVKICSLYGAGFYYVPGTDTCIKFGGYVRAEATLNTTAHYSPPDQGLGAAHNRLSDYYSSRSRMDLTVDTRTATEYGVVRTFAEVVWTYTGGTYSGAGNGGTTYSSAVGAQPSQGTPGLYYAFIQFAGFTFGRATSQFSTPWAEYPANSFELPGAAGWDPINQVAYTYDLGQGVSASFALEDGVAHNQLALWNVSGATAAGMAAGVWGANDFGGSRAPDLVASVTADQAWGYFKASAAAHNNHAAYYGATEPTGAPSDKWGWAGQLALSIKNIPTGAGDTINMSAVYTNGASRYNFHDYGNAPSFAMYGSSGLPGAYQSVGIAGVSDAVFVAGAGQELTTTYGFAGGYTHNWNPQWNTSLFGAYSAVRYNNTAKGYICSGLVANLALSTGLAGCNPDFNYSVIGTGTRWTPVKNLTFTAELAYTMLDVKHASGSTVTLPVQTSIAKPAGVYELKDQNALTLLLRAQRNF
ncbi:porin [Bradyrhizobium sp. CCGUVB4N]|uniref:porin n=1 Tax=Bradyrhizobium sp. CCGUVB4N TaxID=2949631 RepID=UPI0020B3FD1D|nr:porin [Bradyrhizobium sp. CCGUVB4N]MCP3380331.1 porin [Bradyrhizobium sp. CCGUVB4N]